MRVWHHKILGAGSYPLEIRLKGDGILVPQCLTINFIYHAPRFYEPFAVTLSIILIVEGDSLDKRIMRTISSRITKLTQCQTRVVSDSSPNA